MGPLKTISRAKLRCLEFMGAIFSPHGGLKISVWASHVNFYEGKETVMASTQLKCDQSIYGVLFIFIFLSVLNSLNFIKF